jgi:hypothetical protein
VDWADRMLHDEVSTDRQPDAQCQRVDSRRARVERRLSAVLDPCVTRRARSS